MDYKMSHGGGYIVYKSDGTVANAQNLFDRLAALEKVAEAARVDHRPDQCEPMRMAGQAPHPCVLCDAFTALAETEKPKP